MTKYNKKHTELIDEIRLVELALEETESILSEENSIKMRENIERRIHDYELHLTTLTHKLEYHESKVK